MVEAVRGIALLQKETWRAARDRRQARWKYTIRRLGVDTVKAFLLRERFGVETLRTRNPSHDPHRSAYHHGWHRGERGAGLLLLRICRSRRTVIQRNWG